jgi:hypothetical protein
VKTPQKIHETTRLTWRLRKNFKLLTKICKWGISILAQLSDLELQELADNQDLSYNDLVENIKSRELLLIWAHLKKEGAVQSDGYILSDLGKLIHQRF